MSYKLQKPFTGKQYADFIVEHNHNNGLKIEETDSAVYALEPDEIMQDGQPVKNPHYASEQLEIAKSFKLEENKQKRDAYLVGGIEYKGVIFDSDTDSKVNIMGALSTLADDAAVGWNSMDNETVILTKAELAQLADLLIQMTSNVWGEQGLNITYINAVNAAQTLEELDSIIIEYPGAQE